MFKIRRGKLNKNALRDISYKLFYFLLFMSLFLFI